MKIPLDIGHVNRTGVHGNGLEEHEVEEIITGDLAVERDCPDAIARRVVEGISNYVNK